MPRLIERIWNVFDDHLTQPSPAAFARPGSTVPAPIPHEEAVAREAEVAATLLALKGDCERGINAAFARLHELSFELHLTPAPDEFRKAVQFIVDSAEQHPVAVLSEQPGPRVSSVTSDASEHEQLPLSLRLAL